jgi:phosphoglycolate phosphatase-like HAD superfamily hydrolase
MKKSKQNDYFNTLKLVLGEDDKEFDINELTNRFTNMYIRIAKNNEKLLIKDSVLEYLKNKYNLYIITGRPRKFYDPIWKNRLDRHFKGVICHGDYEGMPRKPEPDIIIKTIETLRLNAEYYIGNEINDIIATKKAGLKSICIMSSENRIKLLSYNCDIVIDDVNDLPNIL